MAWENISISKLIATNWKELLDKLEQVKASEALAKEK